MRKLHLFIVLLLTLVGTQAWAYDSPSGNSTNSNCYTKSIAIKVGSSTTTINVATKTKGALYYDKTSNVVEVTAGATLSPSVSTSGTNNNRPLNAYVYVDWNQNGAFNVNVTGNGPFTLGTGNELVSFSYYKVGSSIFTSGYNSSGDTNSSNSRTLPSFTVPATAKPGEYTIRYKVDRNDTTSVGSSSLASYGGVVVDFKLKVVKTAPTEDQLTQAQTLKDNKDNLFYPTMTEAQEQAIDAAITAKDGDALQTALDAVTNAAVYNLPETGRYRIKNKVQPDYGCYGYLTCYDCITVSSDNTYYSVWDLTKTVKDGVVSYTFKNEGCAYVMEPLAPRNADGTCKPGKEYLSYDASHSYCYLAYSMTSDATAAVEMVFTPTGSNGEFSMAPKGSDYLATIAYPFDEYKGWTSTYAQNQNNTHYNGNLQACKARGTNSTPTDDALWTMEPMTAASEATLFEGAADKELTGYVGGPITLTDVESVDDLNSIKELIDDYLVDIAECETSSSIAEGAIHAGFYKRIVDLVSAKIEKQYYLDLSEGKEFYIQNISRPKPNARLYDTGSTAYTTSDKTTGEGESAKWVLESVSTPGGKTAFYIKNVSTGKYISSHEAAASNMDVTMVAESAKEDDALRLYRQEVVPGIYLLYDAAQREAVENGNSSEDKATWFYLTIGGNDYKNLTYYDVVEASSLWKIYSLNSVNAQEPKSLGTGIKETSDGPTFMNFSSFSHVLTTEVLTDLEASVYYGVNARFSNENYKDDPNACQLIVTLKKVPAIDDRYYMKGGKGYIILTTANTSFDIKKSITTFDLSTLSADAHKHLEEVEATSLFKPTGAVAIDDSNWQNYYVLDYVDPNTVIGTWKGEDVYGTGLGFYHPKPGTTLSSNMTVINEVAFSGEIGIDWAKYVANTKKQDTKESGIGIEMEFLDEDGNVTGIGQVDSNGKLTLKQGDIYDLMGRKQSTMQRGINIVNGKKILVK